MYYTVYELWSFGRVLILMRIDMEGWDVGKKRLLFFDYISSAKNSNIINW